MKISLCALIVLALAPSWNKAAVDFKFSPIVYNFYDMLAQSACTAKATTNERIWAVRRKCPAGTTTCNALCSNNGTTCFQTYHVYKNPKILELNVVGQPEQGVQGLSMFNYLGACSFSNANCGPNYCCCRGPVNANG